MFDELKEELLESEGLNDKGLISDMLVRREIRDIFLDDEESEEFDDNKPFNDMGEFDETVPTKESIEKDIRNLFNY